MNVKHRLTGVPICIDHRSISGVRDAFLPRNLSRDERKSSHHRSVSRFIE